MPKARHVLAIDLGSGGPKVALVGEDGTVAGWEQRATELIFTQGGGVEQDPRQWWQVIREAIQTLLGRQLVPVDDIVAVVTTTQWSVTTPVDADGNVIGNAIHWMDSRGGPHARRLMDGIVKIAGYGATRLYHWLRLTSAAPTHSGADVLSHLLFLKHEQPDVYRRAAMFLEPADYLGLRLSGRKACSYASIFPYFLTDNRDCRNVRYSEKLLRLTGIDREKLPDLVPVDTILGPILPNVADDLGLSRATQIVVGSGDSHAAVLGSGAIEDGELHLCIGTSSWITSLMPKRKVDVLRSITTMPGIVPGKNMIVAEQGPAGKLIEVLVERWFSDGVPTDSPNAMDARYRCLFERAEHIPAGSDGLQFLPWLNGAGPPAQDSAMRGAFLNLSLPVEPAHAIRAAMEGVACNLRWLADSVERFAQRPAPAMNFIGGGARSDLWCQILADVLDRRIRRIAEPNLAIARGAAFSAMMALRMLTLDQIPRVVHVEREFQPQPENRPVYDALFRDFLQAFRATGKLIHARSRVAPPRRTGLRSSHQ